MAKISNANHLFKFFLPLFHVKLDKMMCIMNRILLFPFFMMLVSLSGFSQNYELSSPDGRIEVEISVDLNIHMASGGGWVAKLKKE